ncbi:MAG: hypothetical protein KBT11_02555 [Treponema sp.]|nr:hypothetical protein [Candidatus Treponema equifaecale]
MANVDSFERLASGLTNDERQSILEQLTSSAQSHEDQAISPINENLDDSPAPFSEQIQKESLLLRFVLWFKSFFTNTPAESLYNEYKLANIGKNIERTFPGLIDSKKGLLLAPFYTKLEELQASAAYLRPFVSATEEDQGAFYVLLSSLVMPEVSGNLNADVDPYTTQVTQTAKPELRMELLRKMDEIFDNIPAQDKTRMYEAVKAAEWLNQFIKLPFAKFMNQFSTVNEGDYNCSFSSLGSEINTFAKVLSTQFVISDTLLQALYLFSVKRNKLTPDQAKESDASQFLDKANSCISLLHMFMTSVPLISIGKLVNNDVHWQKIPFGGGEDWFIQYKNAWKKIFEQKWSSWAKDCQKEFLKVNLKSNFDLNEFPALPEKPWLQLWGGVHFRYDLTAGFLYWFLKKKFQEYEIYLKTLLSEGSFKKRETHTAYSDAFNGMIQVSIDFETLVHQCAPNGEFGMLFTKLQEEHLKTLSAQTKVEQMMRRVESDFGSILHQFTESSRIMINIIGTVLGLARDMRYDGVENLTRIMAKDNEKFQKNLREAKMTMENAQALIAQLEDLDNKKTRF